MPLIDNTMWRFALVGVANTLFGTAVMFLCYNLLGLSYWWSSAMNYVLGSVLSFLLNKHFTFRSRRKSLREVILFTINIIVCYHLAYTIAKPLTISALSSCSVATQENIAMLAGALLFIALNYLGQRLVVFRKTSN